MKRIPEALIQQIVQASDIGSVVGRYVRLTRQGNRLVGLCPFHNEKTPSFGVQPDKGFFYCFGCKKGGDAITFIKEIEQCSYLEAIEHLAEQAGIPLQFEGEEDPEYAKQQTHKAALFELYARLTGTFQYLLLEDPRGGAALDYIRGRGIDLGIIQRFKLGYVPEERGWVYRFLRGKGYSGEFLAQSGLFSSKHPDYCIFGGRLVFPIMDARDRPIAFGGRLLGGDGPKYINSPETLLFQKSEQLYALSVALPAIREQKRAIICEGYMDVLAYHQAEIAIAVAPLGTSFTEAQAQILKRYASTISLCFDSDKAGTDATLRAYKILAKHSLGVTAISFEDSKDPAEILQKNGARQLKILAESTITMIDYLVGRASEIARSRSREEALDYIFACATEFESEIGKQQLLEQVAGAFNLDPYSVVSDFRKFRPKVSGRTEPEQPVRVAQKQSGTLYNGFMAALVLNPEFFRQVRSEFSAADFGQDELRDVFIVMEELFRRDELTSQEIVARLANQELKTFILEKAAAGDYAVNPGKVISDALYRLRLEKLGMLKARLVGRIKNYDPIRDADEVSLNDLLYEKMHLDGEIARLKDEWHERN